MATQECIWLKRLMGEIFPSSSYPISILCVPRSLKHIFTSFRESLNARHLEKTYSKEQVADIFTKTLAKVKFEEFRSALDAVDHLFAPRESVKN